MSKGNPPLHVLDTASMHEGEPPSAFSMATLTRTAATTMHEGEPPSASSIATLSRTTATAMHEGEPPSASSIASSRSMGRSCDESPRVGCRTVGCDRLRQQPRWQFAYCSKPPLLATLLLTQALETIRPSRRNLQLLVIVLINCKTMLTIDELLPRWRNQELTVPKAISATALSSPKMPVLRQGKATDCRNLDTARPSARR